MSYLQNKKMYIAFYKSNYRWWSRLIKWWTGGKYSHCEFYDGKQLIGISNEQMVRKLRQPLNMQKWDIYELQGLKNIHEVIENFYNKTQGKKYDWKGIIYSCIFNRRKHNVDKYTCSEYVMECLDKEYNLILPKNYIMILPCDLYDVLRAKKLIKKFN